MPATRYSLAPLSERQVHPRAAPAAKHLTVAHSTLQGIFDSLLVVRIAAKEDGWHGRGRPSESEVDLLRSAIVLAGAGLDAVIKRLARDALPDLLAVGTTQTAAHKVFKTHVSSQIRGTSPSTSWTEAVLANDPRLAMIEVYVMERTQKSLQAEGDLRAMRDALGIGVKLIPDERISALRPFLTARNQVAHDLDLREPDDESRGNRRSRTMKTVVDQCDLALGVAGVFVDAVSEALGGPPSPGRIRKAKA